MKNLETLLTEYGIEIPDDKKEAFMKDVHANYKTVAEYEKLTQKVTAAQQRAEDAEAAIKKFDGLDPEDMKKQIADLQKKAQDAETEYNGKIAQMELDEALDSGLQHYKFSSNAAKEAIAAKVREAKLPVKDKKLLGLDDLMQQYMESDSNAFVTDAEENKARFAGTGAAPKKRMTKEEIMKIKDRTARLKAIAENQDLFG